MDPASSVASELWPPPPHHHHHNHRDHHLHLASAGPHHEASSVVTAADRSSGARPVGGGGGGGSSSSRRRPRRDAAAAPSEEEPSKLVSTSGTAAASSSAGGQDSADPEAKRLKQMASSENTDKMRTEVETNSGKSAYKKPAPPEPPKDYIHVRARRGQATDSHSLAERARREKISERMKALQDLVPGCNKVIGKASVLDEIINYIQSLQCQVEFLSMKLEAVNAHVNNASVAFPSKDFGAPSYNTAPGLTFDPQTPREYAQGSASDWLHMQIGSAYERVT